MPFQRSSARSFWLAATVILLLASSFGARAAGLIIYRVYLPARDYQEITLPTLTYEYSDGRPSITAPPCEDGLRSKLLLALAGKRCSWGKVVNPAVSLVNIAYPDLNAYYWVTRFDADTAMRIKISGVFPDARYMSINLYDDSLSPYSVNGVPSALADFRIEPDPRNVNPWQQISGAGGHFTLYAVNDPHPGDINTLPLPPSTIAGSGFHPPKPCTTDCPPLNQFQRPSDISGLLPNADNAYVAAITRPLPGQVLVVRGKAPLIPPGTFPNHPLPWPNSAQVRYWSLCNNLYLPPYPVVINRHHNQPPESGCVADYQVSLDDDGYYTIVVGAARAKPEQLPPDVSWLPNSALLPNVRHLLILRNMLAEEFPNSIQNVPADDQPASAQTVMGDYYPRIYPCAQSTFEQQGWQACVNTPE